MLPVRVYKLLTFISCYIGCAILNFSIEFVIRGSKNIYVYMYYDISFEFEKIWDLTSHY